MAKKASDGSVTMLDKERPNVRILSKGDSAVKTSVRKSYICQGMTELPARLVSFETKPLWKGIWEKVIEGV